MRKGSPKNYDRTTYYEKRRGPIKKVQQTGDSHMRRIQICLCAKKI